MVGEGLVRLHIHIHTFRWSLCAVVKWPLHIYVCSAPHHTLPSSPPHTLTGGERGVLLQLKLDTHLLNGAVAMETLIHSAACCVKVFKDKGGDRKQRQDLQKIDKLSPEQQVFFPRAGSVTGMC